MAVDSTDNPLPGPFYFLLLPDPSPILPFYISYPKPFFHFFLFLSYSTANMFPILILFFFFHLSFS